MKENERYWYAVYTKPRWEKKVASLLEAKGVEYYCPLNKVIKQWSDRKKTILEPLFKSYVFVQVEEKRKWELMNINGILNYVHYMGKPAKIRNSEIETVKRFLNEFDSVDVVESSTPANARVKIRQGVLMNYHGVLLEVTGNKASVKIESMGLQLTAVFDKSNLEVLEEKKK
ncbi:MAG TPA: UpxY family transcription antiterminator [Ferruginibacter sp.]|nr:UpxY family transcription antiterminator [Ferruginibacter sp.]